MNPTVQHKILDFNKRAKRAEQNGYVTSCGAVYEKESFVDPRRFSIKICDVKDYPLKGKVAYESALS